MIFRQACQCLKAVLRPAGSLKSPQIILVQPDYCRELVRLGLACKLGRKYKVKPALFDWYFVGAINWHSRHAILWGAFNQTVRVGQVDQRIARPVHHPHHPEFFKHQ